MHPNYKNYNYKDPLFVTSSKAWCSVCNNEEPLKSTCTNCKSTGYQPVNLNGMWYPSSGFLVCGGPSINKIPYQRLRERGIVSLAVNNVAAHVPVSAWCFSDPQTKFHHGLFLDPKCITFTPVPKLRRHIIAKLPNKKFQQMDARVRHCPSSFGFARKTTFHAETFLTSEFSYWGRGGKQPENDKPFQCLCTMLLGFRLMHYLGCPRIYLLGVDFWMEKDKQNYAFVQEKSARNGRYKNENAYLKELKPVFDAAGFEVFNCNKESKCDVFQYVPFEEALEDCRGGVPLEPFDTEHYYSKSIAKKDMEENPKTINIAELAELQRDDKKTS